MQNNTQQVIASLCPWFVLAIWLHVSPMVNGQDSPDATTNASNDAASDWLQWRGPNGTGDAGSGEYPTKWDASTNILWKSEVPGRGLGTPIVIGEFVVVTTAIPVGEKLPPRMSGRPGAHDNLPVDSRHEFVVMAFDRKTGVQRWRTRVNETLPIEGAHKSASLASASCVSDGNLVFAYFGSFGLYCLNLAGEVQWQRQFGQMHSKHGHGEGASPAIHQDAIIVNWDHEGQSFVVSLNKATGEENWRRMRDEVTSWSTPIVIESDGGSQVIVAGTNRVRSYDFQTGKTIWECGGMSANIVATPVYRNGILIVGSSYEKRIMMAIRIAGSKGDITGTDQVLWSRIRGTPYVPSMLIADDGVYFLAHYQNILTRVDLVSGREAPGAMRLGDLGSIYASPVAAGNHVYITDLDGTTMVITRGTRPQPVSVNVLDEPVSASLAFASEQIFIRGDRHLYCITRSR
ncbi:MAG: PQQ-binding-like beta-propeller repeat protein [Aureliella sp.]